MNLKNISTGGYDVLASGLVYGYDDKSNISFTISDDKGKDIKFEFEFRDDKESDKGVESELQDNDTTLKIICNNFEKGLGSGYTKPFNVGVVDDKKLFLNFWAGTLGHSNVRRLEYCFYRER